MPVFAVGNEERPHGNEPSLQLSVFPNGCRRSVNLFLSNPVEWIFADHRDSIFTAERLRIDQFSFNGLRPQNRSLAIGWHQRQFINAI